MIVTGLEDYNKNRIKISLDNETEFLLYKGEVKKYCLKQNDFISDETYNLIMEMLYGRARERALYLLDDSYKTEKQVRDKLKNGQYPEQIINRVIENLKEYNLINDLNYASVYIEYKADKKSKKQIIQDLYVKGISKDNIDMAFDESEYSEEVSLYRILEKRISKYPLNEKKDLQKLYQYLIGKGYGYSNVKNAISKYMNMD